MCSTFIPLKYLNIQNLYKLKNAAYMYVVIDMTKIFQTQSFRIYL